MNVKTKKADKKIKFTYVLDEIDKLSKIKKHDSYSPCEYDVIELICKNYFLGSDLMFASFNNKPKYKGQLFIGQYNSGIFGSYDYKNKIAFDDWEELDINDYPDFNEL